MKEQVLEDIREIANSHSRALRRLHQTVDYARDEVIDEALVHFKEGRQVFLMGVKNSAAIAPSYIQSLGAQGFLFHTLDSISEKGRAIYANLSNPLTARPMTGSSATTCLHILQGVNHLGIGTDGGGSVLAPALSCGLYAIMGKGLGLKGEAGRISTDGIPFQPGIGIIGREYELCRRAIYVLLGKDAAQASGVELKRIGLVCWQGEESSWQERIREDLKEYSFEIFIKEKTTKREELISIYQEVMSRCSFFLSKEGPIDLFGLGDSILGGFGELGNQMQQDGEKYFVKIANMVDATAIAIPAGELASGYLLAAPKGEAAGLAAIELGRRVVALFQRPKIYDEYFFGASMEKGFLR